MDFFITKRGLSRAVELSGGKPGFVVKIAYFKVGSKAGFQPDDTMVDIQGAEMYKGYPTEYTILGDGRAKFSIYMDETLGTWQFGNIGLFLEDGTLYALGALQRTQWKIGFPDKDYNRVKLQMTSILGQETPSITIQTHNTILGALFDVDSPDFLPAADDSLTNTYVALKTDENENPGLWIRKEGTWFCETYPTTVGKGTIEQVQRDGRSFSSVALPSGNYGAGSAIIRFRSGAGAGLIRRVLNIRNKSAHWATPLTVQPGDTFEILATASAGASSGTTSTLAQDLLYLSLING